MPLVVPYDPLWPLEFEAESRRITRACDDLALVVEHVGSTAVPDLAAKPIIDIMVGVPPRASRAPYVAALVSLGYDHLGSYGIPGRDYFRRGSPRTHHVHMVTTSSAFWRDQLLFRDTLRADASLAREYAALKRELAGAFADDGKRYTEEKGPFIRAVLRRAREARAPR